MTAPFSSRGGRDRLRRPTFGQPLGQETQAFDPAAKPFGPGLPIVQHPVTALHSTSWLKENLRTVPDRGGTYAFYLRAKASLPFDLPVASTPLDEAVPIYIGKTTESLRRRLKQHLFGDARVSQLKANLGVLAQDALGLAVRPIPGKRYFVFADERPLDDWIAEHVMVGYRETDDPTQMEAAWLASSPGILNVLGRAETTVTRLIRAQRKMASGRQIPLPWTVRPAATRQISPARQRRAGPPSER